MNRAAVVRLIVVFALVTSLGCGALGPHADGDAVGRAVVVDERALPLADRGGVRGVVVDTQGMLLPGVTVTLNGNGEVLVAITNGDGRFRFPNVRPGIVTVVAELSGFGSVVQSNVQVRMGFETALLQELSPALEQTITVAAETPVLDRRRTGTGAIFGGGSGTAPRRRSVSKPKHALRSTPAAQNVWKVAPSSSARQNSDEEYAAIVSNGFVETRENPLATFSIDVDTASYSNVRRMIRDGYLPPPEAVRVEELLNYFRYDDPEPFGSEAFSVHTEVAGCPWTPDNRLVRIGIRGREIPDWEAPPHNLVFLIDVSGSMKDNDKLPMIKDAFRLFADELRGDDTVSIITYAHDTEIALSPTSGADKVAITDAVDSLEAEGSTNGAGAIQLAYETVKRGYRKGGNNRIILATDGDFNVGASTSGELEQLIERERDAGIFLTVLGVGTGNLKDSRMELLADKGNGNYAYLDSLLEAKKVLVHEIGGTLQAIARDMKIQLEFDCQRVEAYRLVGYENRLLATEDFEDDTKDAGELGSGHSVTALFEVVPRGSTGEIGRIQLRYKDGNDQRSRLLVTNLVDDGSSFDAASSDLKWAAAVAEYALLLQGSEYRGQATLEHVLDVARLARGLDIDGYRGDFIQLVESTAVIADGSLAPDQKLPVFSKSREGE